MNRIKPASKCSIKPTQDHLWRMAALCMLLREEIFPDVFKFVHKYKAIPAPVMIMALSAITKYRPKDPWPYGRKILSIQAGLFYANINEERHEKEKMIPDAKKILAGIMEYVGAGFPPPKGHKGHRD